MKFLPLLAVLCMAAPAAHALSCVMMDVAEAREVYPAVVSGEVLESHFEPAEKPHLLHRGYQHVTLQLHHAHLPDEAASSGDTLIFREVVSAYDGSFFRIGEGYVVFLERDEDTGAEEQSSGWLYPVCGVYFPADASIHKELGW